MNWEEIMGILLQVEFRGSTCGEVMARRDEEGNFLIRDVEENGNYFYRRVNAPPLPPDVISVKEESSVCNTVSSYVQMSDDVFIDLSCFHPLMHITRLLVYSYRAKQGMGEIELILSFPRGYADKIENVLELYRGNINAVGQKWVAEDIFFQSDSEILSFNIAGIAVVERGDKLTEFKLVLHSQSKLQIKPRRLQRVMQAEDLNCTLILNNARRDFDLGYTKKTTKKGHHI